MKIEMRKKEDNMKKIFSLFMITITVFILVGCQDDLGEFPEVKETQKVEMTAEEVNLLMADVNLEEQMDQAMMLSVDLDISSTQVVYPLFDFFDEGKIGDRSLDLILSSKTYVSLSDQIDEVLLHSENTIDLRVDTNYVDDAIEDETLEVIGDANVYFTDQYLYYDSDVTGLEEDEFLENGKYKLNFGITQTMWDEIYQSPTDLADDFLDIGVSPQDLLSNLDVMGVMLEADMLSIYKNGDAYTFIFEMNKDNILDNLELILDAFMDTEAFTQADYEMYEAEIEDMLADFTQLEMLYALVIEDNMVKKVGVDINAIYADDEMTFDITGKLVFDMAVDIPKLPDDLDTYELTDLS
jgi:hypothetical protein